MVTFLCGIEMHLSDLETAQMAGGSGRTIAWLKMLPSFPRTETGRVSRLEIFAFLIDAVLSGQIGPGRANAHS